MRKTARKKVSREAAAGLQLLVPLAEVVRADLREFVIGRGMEALALMLEQERDQLCGPAYARGQTGRPRRAGSARGRLTMGGRRVTVRRPRVRDEQGEVELPTWASFASDDALQERALEQMVLGVSTRRYDRSLEDVPDGLGEHGTSRSAVSRRFKAATEKQLEEWLGRDLSEIPLAAVVIDGLCVDDQVLMIALGIDESGRKHVLGLWAGPSENTDVCKGLLNDLVRRGVDPQRSMLFVIDGSPALRKAIDAVFGKRALVQRCQVHKKRNVLSHLPKEMHTSIGKAIADAYGSTSPAVAKKRLVGLANQLEDDYPSASRSLREGLDETLTVKAMKLSAALARTLSTTNSIENLNGGVRRVSARVKRWRDGKMIMRWTAASLLESAQGFRRLRGFKSMPQLLAALRRNDDQFEPSVARHTEVA